MEFTFTAEHFQRMRREFQEYQQLQIQENLKFVKHVATRIVETVLRLPGLILLELWWRNRDITFDEIKQRMMEEEFYSYFDVTTILDFVHRRNFDQSAAHILSYSVLFLSLMFLTLPLSKLGRMYAHMLSLSLFGFAHYMSTTYVSLEQTSKDPDIKLDDFVKLERHGFHFLAQLLLSVVQSFVLGLESDLGRVTLTVFTIPIVARMSGCPLDKLIVAHNVACSLAMLSICVYVLNGVPAMALSFRVALRQMKAIFVIRGLAHGAVTVWRRLRIAELLTYTWLSLFAIRMYVEVWEKNRGWREAGPALLASVAESTHTPLSLLALALTVSFVCKWIVDLAQLAVGGTRDHGHVLAHSGYTEALTLVLLCAQTGLLGMKTEQKAFLLGLVLFIVMSALLQSLFELLEPQLIALSSSPNATRARHARCLVLTAILFVAPMVMAYAITAFLPVDLWCVIIVSNCMLTTLHSASAFVQYVIGVIECGAVEPWEKSDDWLFWVKTATKILELVIALMVVNYGVYMIFNHEWTLASVGVLIFHVFVNVWRRLDVLRSSLVARRAAVHNMQRLPRATKQQLAEREDDVCAICCTEMVCEARVTPCKHVFHGACLRKWLAVKQVCPLCYSNMLTAEEEEATRTREEPVVEEEEQPVAAVPAAERAEEREREQQRDRIHAARDMWPLLDERQFDDENVSDDDDTASSTATDYTMASGEE